jgi:hypothetical protein
MNTPTQEELRQIGATIKQCETFVGKLIRLIENGYLVMAQMPGHRSCPTCCSERIVDTSQFRTVKEETPSLHADMEYVLLYLLGQADKPEFSRLNPEISEKKARIAHLEEDDSACGCCQESVQEEITDLEAEITKLYNEVGYYYSEEEVRKWFERNDKPTS